MPGLPADLEEALWRAAEARLGAGRLRARTLAPAIAAVSRRYTTEREGLGAGGGGADQLAARLLFFGPSDAPKVQVPLGELAAAGALPAARPLRVLDVGAGTGAMSLGLLAYLRGAGIVAEVALTALDGDGAAL
ncbi:MAG TPA: hypothetical protein VGQ83_15995, partial [Polyangia bacterium]